MSRIDSSRGTPLPNDTSPESAAAPASSRLKSRHAPAAAARAEVRADDGPPPHRSTPGPSRESASARNEVRTYDGPPPSSTRESPSAGRSEVRASDGPPHRSTQGLARGGVPAVPGPAVSAGELAALGGLPRVPTDVPGPVYDDLRSHLTRSFLDWALTERDVKAVHAALGTLRPEAYRATLERMERDGLLGTYVKAQDADTRRAFLEQAESKGMLQRRKGDAPAGPLGYPAVPDFFLNDARLPASMRDAVNQHAIHAGVTFYRAHAEYLDRYTEAVNAATSLQELNALDHPREAHLSDSVLGIESGRDRVGREYEAEWRRGIGQPVSRNRAYQAARARELELTGERPGGSLQVHGKAELTHRGAKVATEAQLDTRGRVDLKQEAGLTAKGGPVGLEMTLDTKGKRKVEVKLDLGLVRLSQDSEGELKLGLGVGRHAEAFVALNPTTAEFGGGASAELDLGGNTVGAETGFSMKGLTARRVAESFDTRHRGLFDDPVELSARTEWDALSAEQRALYAGRGWTRDTWTRALAR